MSNDETYIRHILECIEHIHYHTRAGKDSFFQDLTVQDAALRKLQLLGESLKRLSDDTKKTLPEIEWRKISGFRNILVHEYLGDLNYEVVWVAISDRLPDLKRILTDYLKSIT